MNESGTLNGWCDLRIHYWPESGGLGLVNVASSMMFGAISGSAVASASAMGSALILS